MTDVVAFDSVSMSCPKNYKNKTVLVDLVVSTYIVSPILEAVAMLNEVYIDTAPACVSRRVDLRTRMIGRTGDA